MYKRDVHRFSSDVHQFSSREKAPVFATFFDVMVTFNDVRQRYVVLYVLNVINACNCLCYSQTFAGILALI